MSQGRERTGFGRRRGLAAAAVRGVTGRGRAFRVSTDPPNESGAAPEPSEPSESPPSEADQPDSQDEQEVAQVPAAEPDAAWVADRDRHPVRTALRELAALSANGALHLEAEPGAIIYLRDGLICHIDSGIAPDIGTLLLASGRLPGKVWEGAVAAAAGAGRVGPLLVEEGHLSQGELEFSAMGALYDAAFFVLGARPTSVRFANGEASWLGAPISVGVEPLWREVERRWQLLDEALPTAVFDTAPVLPVARLPRQQVVLDGLRWELLMHADGRRGPVELARMLGRAAYAAVLETRRMAAAGLLRAPAPVQAPPPALPPASAPEPTSGAPVTAYRPPTSGSVANGGSRRVPALPRRRPGAGSGAPPGAPPGAPAGATSVALPNPPPELAFEPPTNASLARFRDGLAGFS